MRLRRHICIVTLCVFATLTGVAQTGVQNGGTAPPNNQHDADTGKQDDATKKRREAAQPPSQQPQGAASDNVLKEPGSTIGGSRTPEAASRTLTKHQKFQHWIERTYSPYTIAGVTFDATWAQMWGDWPQYGGGMQGWGKRFGATLADTETRTFFGQFLFPVMFHQDPRYFPSQKTGLIPRAWYAGTRVLIARRDGDGNMFNWSEFAAVLATAGVQNAYYPSRDKGFPETMSRFVGGVGSDVTSNLLREFWPDIKKTFRKHEPEKMKRLEKKVPGADKIGEMVGPSSSGTAPRDDSPQNSPSPRHP